MRHSEELIRAVEKTVIPTPAGPTGIQWPAAVAFLDAIRAAEDAAPARDRQLASTIVDVLMRSPMIRLDDITAPILADQIVAAVVADWHVCIREDVTEPLRPAVAETADDRSARAPAKPACNHVRKCGNCGRRYWADSLTWCPWCDAGQFTERDVKDRVHAMRKKTQTEVEHLHQITCVALEVPEADPVDFDAMVASLYETETGGAGCCLHVALDDGNMDDGAVDFCIKQAVESGHALCEKVARHLRAWPEDKRQRYYDAQVAARLPPAHHHV